VRPRARARLARTGHSLGCCCCTRRYGHDEKVVSIPALELGEARLNRPDLPVTFRGALALVQAVFLRLDSRSSAEMFNAWVGFCAAL
jgi:hypothetical protein